MIYILIICTLIILSLIIYATNKIIKKIEAIQFDQICKKDNVFEGPWLMKEVEGMGIGNSKAIKIGDD